MAEIQWQINQKWGAQGRAAYARGAEGLSGRSARSGGMSEVNNVLIARHEKRAEILRADAARAVQASIGTMSGRWAADRRAQSTGFLAKITGARENSLATIYQVGIGRADYLDTQTARYGRYWRSFESGFGGHVGDRIRFPGRFKVNGKWTTLKSLPATRGRANDPSIRTVPWGPAVIIRPIQAHGIYAELGRKGAPIFRKELREDARIYLNGLASSRRR